MTTSETQPEPDHIRAHRHSVRNRAEISRSELCGCFYCLAMFPPSDIQRWTDDAGEATALCPNCQVDAVIGSASGFAITPELLKRMHDHWFAIQE